MSDARRLNERYHLEQRVSSKDTGSVYRAQDTLSGETVAVKVIDADDLEDRRERFQEFARILQSIHHPALPRLLDSGLTAAGSAYLVTELLQGIGLDTLTGAPAVRTLGLLLFAVDGLEALADAGLAHGNLRSDNIYLVNTAGGEEVKLLGLGTGVLREPLAATDDFRNDLRDFATLAAEVLGATIQSGDGRPQAELPTAATVGLRDPDALHSFLNEVLLRGDPEARFTSWDAVRQVLRRALVGGPGRATDVRQLDAPLPGSGTVRMPLSQLRRQMEEQHSVPDEELKTRVFHPEELAPPPDPEPPPPPPEPPPASPPAGGTMRVDLRSEAERLRGATMILPAQPEPPAAPPEPVQGGTVRIDIKAAQAASSKVGEGLAPSRADGGAEGENRAFPPTWEGASPSPTEETEPEPPPPPPPPPPLPLKAPAPVPPPPPVAAPAAAPRPPVAPPPPVAKSKTPIILIAAGGALGLLLLIGAVGFLLLGRQKPPVHLPLPVVEQKPVPQPVVPTQATPPPVNPQIPLAEGFLAAGDLAKAQEAIAAIPANQELTPEERERLQRVLDAVTAQQAGQAAGGLAKALSSGDAQALRAAVNAIRPDEEAALPRTAKRDLARARKILDLDARLARTEKEGHPLEIVREASALLAEQPRSSRALKARDDAAAGIEAEAEAKEQAGQLDAAATRLEQLRDVWPSRRGLAEHIERLRTEDKTNREMDDALASASRAGLAGKPLDGLRILKSVKPSARYADRFREAQARLEQQFAQLDRRPPEVELRKEADKLAYEKGAAAVIPLRITDDFGVETVEAWARPEGGQYTQVSPRRTGATEYELAIPPSLHDNKTIDLYVTATDRSGHKGTLGSAAKPIQIKRKGLFSKIFGKKE